VVPAEDSQAFKLCPLGDWLHFKNGVKGKKENFQEIPKVWTL
jgi:hypothetical protein